ncbi:MAG TPA: Uma2 family endonuclease [Pyrinomonadaceae bacterium]|nr:Uma2 family endonuclease [Pyrinomonadaceae bacterium]
MQTVTETIPNNLPFFIKETFVEEPRQFKWTKSQYHQLAELGLFEGKRTEFLEGEIIEMPTMNSPHATGLTLTDDALRKIFSEGFVIRNQMPLDFEGDFETVPDLAIVKGNTRDFFDSHPQTADLVIEVSDTTLSYDRNRKASLYAKFGINDYWVLNLKNQKLEVYRSPIEDENAYYGFSFSEKLTFKESDEVSPFAKPDAKIKVADLLP